MKKTAQRLCMSSVVVCSQMWIPELSVVYNLTFMENVFLTLRTCKQANNLFLQDSSLREKELICFVLWLRSLIFESISSSVCNGVMANQLIECIFHSLLSTNVPWTDPVCFCWCDALAAERILSTDIEDSHRKRKQQ